MSGASSLFTRLALLIAGVILLFSVVVWQVIVWSTLGAATRSAVQTLTGRVQMARAAALRGDALPAEASLAYAAPPEARFWRGPFLTRYLDSVTRDLRRSSGAREVTVPRVGPAEIWFRFDELPGRWVVLEWRIAGPKAPLASLLVLAAGALIVLIGAAVPARRMTAPLGALVRAADSVAAGERVEVDAGRGPSEVRALARAFQSMSQRLARAEEQRELMLGGISHDLRTPLARLRVAVELLEAPDAKLLEEMTASIEEMDRMLGQFLHYVRAAYREMPALAVVDEVIAQALRAEAADPHVRLVLGAAERRSFAVEALRHGVLNLTRNAMEYGEAPVTVRSALRAQALEVVVHDAGCGLSPDEWQRAVRPFERIGDAPQAGHSGLGLALVERLVVQGGGTLTAAQSADGFSVRLSLPAAPPAP